MDLDMLLDQIFTKHWLHHGAVNLDFNRILYLLKFLYQCLPEFHEDGEVIVCASPG